MEDQGVKLEKRPEETPAIFCRKNVFTGAFCLL